MYWVPNVEPHGLRAGLHIAAADLDDGAEPVDGHDEHVQRRLLPDIQRGGQPTQANALLSTATSPGGEQASRVQGDLSGWLLAFVEVKFKVPYYSIRSPYCDKTFVLMSTKAINQPDGSPCSVSLLIWPKRRVLDHETHFRDSSLKSSNNLRFTLINFAGHRARSPCRPSPRARRGGGGGRRRGRSRKRGERITSRSPTKSTPRVTRTSTSSAGKEEKCAVLARTKIISSLKKFSWFKLKSNQDHNSVESSTSLAKVHRPKVKYVSNAKPYNVYKWPFSLITSTTTWVRLLSALLTTLRR